MPEPLHSAIDIDIQPDVALYPSSADWRDQFIYSLTSQTRQGQRSG